MTGRTPGRAGKLVVALFAALACAAMAASAASAGTVYSNIAKPLAGNFASIGNEAYSNSELGSLVQFASTKRNATSVTVGMSSWACQEGGVFSDDCKSGKKATFEWPVRLNIYNVGPGNSVGSLVATSEKTFAMPYRPSVNNVMCTGESAGGWYDKKDASCFHGKGFRITFPLEGVTLPNQAIISVQYNTSDHGPAPVGEAPCRSTASGCFYDSLNVALIEAVENTHPIGSNPDANELFANTQYNEIDCGSSENLGTFGPTGACWEGEQVALVVKATK
jgi:hypothetical protein